MLQSVTANKVVQLIMYQLTKAAESKQHGIVVTLQRMKFRKDILATIKQVNTSYSNTHSHCQIFRNCNRNRDEIIVTGRSQYWIR